MILSFISLTSDGYNLNCTESYHEDRKNIKGKYKQNKKHTKGSFRELVPVTSSIFITSAVGSISPET